MVGVPQTALFSRWWPSKAFKRGVAHKKSTVAASYRLSVAVHFESQTFSEGSFLKTSTEQLHELRGKPLHCRTTATPSKDKQTQPTQGDATRRVRIENAERVALTARVSQAASRRVAFKARYKLVELGTRC